MTAGELEVFDSSRMLAAERFEAWKEAVSSAFVPLSARAAEPGNYSGSLRAQRIGSIGVIEVTGDPVQVIRDRQAISLGDPGVYKLGLQVRGYSVLAQDGREAALTPGDLAIYDTTRPYDLVFDSSYRMIVVQIPRNRLALSQSQLGRITAERISGRQGLGSLTSVLLRRMSEQLSQGGIEPDPRAADAVLELVSATLSSRLHSEQSVPTRRAIWLQCLSYIDQNLADPGLSVNSVAAQAHVSVRYLQKLFAEQGTSASDWIRSRRLEQSRLDLANSTDGHSVASIALRWGYSDASSFARAFKQAFGATPAEFRYSYTPASKKR